MDQGGDQQDRPPQQQPGHRVPEAAPLPQASRRIRGKPASHWRRARLLHRDITSETSGKCGSIVVFWPCV
eukprot:3840228-Pyramimonas_sp.AAC.1